MPDPKSNTTAVLRVHHDGSWMGKARLMGRQAAPTPQLEGLFNLIESGPLTVATAARRGSTSEAAMGRAVGIFAKLGAVDLT